MYIVMSSIEVISNWDDIKNDTSNSRPDIETPHEYIHESKKGRVFAGSVQVIVSDKIPEFE